MSHLDHLPNEVMQLIFEYCPDSYLPLSSPVISKQLSVERFYLRHATSLLYQSPNDKVKDEDRDHAITVMLRRRWMTWPRFQKVVLASQQLYVGSRLDNAGAAGSSCTARDERSLSLPNFDNPRAQPAMDYLRLNRSHCVPAKLLRRPWTPEKTQFLYYLVWLQVGIDWERSTLGEMATTALHSAISTCDRLAVASLVGCSIGCTPSMEDLRAAVMRYGCDPTIVFHLLAAGVRSHILARKHRRPADINFRDPSLWSWASRHKESHRKGEWLTEALRYAADFAINSSSYDETLHADLIRAFGREEHDVEQISVPIFGESV